MSQLKQAARQLALHPALSVVVILTLAVGIGATTAMFSRFQQIFVRPLNVPAPEQLANLEEAGHRHE